MTALQALYWGAFGGFAVEAAHLWRANNRLKQLPWKAAGEPGFAALMFSFVMRTVVGSGLALAAQSSGQISGAMGALTVGVCALLIIDQIGKSVPIALPSPEPTARAAPIAAETTANQPEIVADAGGSNVGA